MIHSVASPANLTIGLFTAGLSEPAGCALWQGVVGAARQCGVNVLTFSGSNFETPPPYQAQTDILYDWVTANKLDGLIIDGNNLGRVVDKTELARVYRQYQALPVVSIGPAPEDCAVETILPLVSLPSDELGRRALRVLLAQLGKEQAVALLEESTPPPALLPVDDHSTGLWERALCEVGQALTSARDQQELIQALVNGLPRLQIRQCYVAQYQFPGVKTEEVILLLAYSETEGLNRRLDGQSYPARQLIPSGLPALKSPYQLIVEPLYFNDEALGFAVFEPAPNQGPFYKILQVQFSSMLRYTGLIQQHQLVEKTLIRRMAELETAAEVSTAVATILESDQMLQAVVDLTRNRFDLYDAHIYLVDDTGKALKLVVSAKTLGQRIMAEGRRIAIDQPKSPVAQVVRTRQGLLLNQLRQSTDYEARIFLPEVQSLVAVPMIAGETLWGVLSVQSDEDAHFAADDVRVYTSLAAQVAVALKNAYRFQQERAITAKTEDRARHLALLNEMGHMLTTRLDTDGVIDEIYRGTSRLLDTSNFYIALCRPAKDEIVFALKVINGKAQKPYDARPLGQNGLVDYLLTTRKPLLLADHMTTRLAELGIKRIFYVPGQAAVSWLGAPIIIGGRVIGVMAALSYTTPGAFNDYDQELLSAIAAQAAVALENARLFEQAQARVRQEEILREVSTQVRASVEVDSVMRVAVQEMGRVFGRRTFICLTENRPIAPGEETERERL